MERTARDPTLAEKLEDLLGQIGALYQDDVVLTLVARSLNSPDGSRDTCVTNDPDVEAAAEALRRLWRDPGLPSIAEAVHGALNS